MTTPSSTNDCALVWFRNDLRLADNPAVVAAVDSGRPTAFLYILDDETPGKWQPGGAARWWLHGSLAALRDELEKLGGSLILRTGAADKVVPEVVKSLGAGAVYWNRGYDPFTMARDKKIKTALKDRDIEVESFGGTLLNEPWTIETKTGGFYKVYTRYWHAVRDKGDPPTPIDAPTALVSANMSECESDALDDWALLPTAPDWAGGFRDRWTPGEKGAMARLEAFLDTTVREYKERRDFPAEPKTSNLSPHLHVGDISPRQIWHKTVDTIGWTDQTEAFLKEVVWREFAHHVFYYIPELPDDPMSAKFADFPWEENADALKAWQTGKTGYPLVDAGMRELWQTGHMHNRVRMVVGSFLVKHLLLPWQAGEAWFWNTLVDADLAVNSFSWQWVAGCGADAAPYFRIFNPITQAEKFDPDGMYIRTYVPELADLPGKHIFRPWEAPEMVLKAAGVELGKTYPRPIVDHKFARERALDAFKSLPKPAA